MASTHRGYEPSWLRRKHAALHHAGSEPPSSGAAVQTEAGGRQFANDFSVDDLDVFDDSTLREMLRGRAYGLSPEKLGHALRSSSAALTGRVRRSLSRKDRIEFDLALIEPLPMPIEQAERQGVLDALFWELTYWKSPELYAELTEGEQLHPGIFRDLAPLIRDEAVLDAGAGAGRASFECVRHGARRVYAVEPSAGLLRLLRERAASRGDTGRIMPLPGRFERLPLGDNSVGLAISCSAFTAAAAAGGEPGLAELRRVTRPGGRIVIIWPRREDHAWLAAQGFRYVALPVAGEMTVRFRSLRSALRCARRFYSRNDAILRHLLTCRRSEIPFSLLDMDPPHDYCWLSVG